MMKFAEHGNLPIVVKLVKNGANVNAVSLEGHTALGEAVYYGNSTEVVEFLINSGADCKVRYKGKSLLEIAKTGLKEYEEVNNAMVVERYTRIKKALESCK